jgi:hypothetical protein
MKHGRILLTESVAEYILATAAAATVAILKQNCTYEQIHLTNLLEQQKRNKL